MLPHVQLLLAVSTWVRLRRLGGVGLVLLGIADNSVIPLTGSMDVLTIWLAARHREPWPYYALDGNRWRCDRRLHHLRFGSKGRQGSDGAQAFEKTSRKSLQEIRKMGIRRDCDSSHSASAVSFCAVPAGSRCHAVLAKEVPGGASCSVAEFAIRSLPTSGCSTETTSSASSPATTNRLWPY